MADKDSKVYIIGVAIGLCLVCSIFVSAAAVMLKPQQQQNKLLDKQKNILKVVDLLEPGAQNVAEVFNSRVESKIIDLESGEYVQGDPTTYDMYKASKDPAQSIALSGAEDIAGIGSKPKRATVYLVKDENGSVTKYVLPINGYGLWSTLYGYLALEADANTVAGITFYQHAETPGLGGEVDNPSWKEQWEGKHIYGSGGNVKMQLVKGGVGPSTPDAEHKVDALAGATLTSTGVTNLVQFWMSSQGYKPYLNNVASAKNAANNG